MAKILVVEDESVVAWHLQEALQKLGHEVIAVAQTGREAIKFSAETQPDLVLMDIQLQGNVDGVAASEYIYLQLNLPVVYLTAHADEQTLQRATETSPFGYLVKPFQEAELHSTIKIALRRHQLERALKDAQQWYATTLISIGDATIATDVDGFVAFMNPTAEILTGWEQEQALGEFATRVLDLVYEETGEAIENPLLSAMCCGDTVTLPDRTLLRARDGALRPVGDSAAPIRNREGEIIGGIMVFQDLSDRRRHEALLQRENQILERSQDRLTLQLRERNEQLQQAINGTQLMQRVLEQSRFTTDRSQILQLTIDELGRTLKASYCWAALHTDLTSTIVCESVGDGFELPGLTIGTHIDLEKHPRFYFRLFQRESWLDPSADLLPPLYRQLQETADQMLICPIQDEQHVIGEVGILTQNRSVGSKLQAHLIAQVVSQSTIALRQAQLGKPGSDA
jgi:PAS domain S-box-containing protein